MGWTTACVPVCIFQVYIVEELEWGLGGQIFSESKEENISFFFFSLPWSMRIAPFKMLQKMLSNDMYSAYLISSGNLWPRWGDQKSSVLYRYGLKCGQTIEAAPWRGGGGPERRRRKGTGCSGQEEQSQLPGISEELRLSQAVRTALRQAGRFDCGSRDAHTPPTVGKNGWGGGFKVDQQLLWHAFHQKMPPNFPPLKDGFAFLTSF